MVRLQRIGKRGQAYFRVVVVEHTKKPKGEYLELLGTYNPHEKVLKVKKDRIEYWVSKGAQASPTVNNLLVNHKIWDKPKVQSWKPKRNQRLTTNNQRHRKLRYRQRRTSSSRSTTRTGCKLNESYSGWFEQGLFRRYPRSG